jgi:hypothetical protein
VGKCEFWQSFFLLFFIRDDFTVCSHRSIIERLAESPILISPDACDREDIVTLLTIARGRELTTSTHIIRYDDRLIERIFLTERYLEDEDITTL